jgi:hypothetical protein
VPLLCLSGVVAGPGPDGGAGGRVLVNLDLTNAQPAPGKFAAALQAVGTVSKNIWASCVTAWYVVCELSDPLPGERLAVPLLCLSLCLVAGPGPDGGAGWRVLVNLDLTNAQPAPGAREVLMSCSVG